VCFFGPIRLIFFFPLYYLLHFFFLCTNGHQKNNYNSKLEDWLSVTEVELREGEISPLHLGHLSAETRDVLPIVHDILSCVQGGQLGERHVGFGQQ